MGICDRCSETKREEEEEDEEDGSRDVFDRERITKKGAGS